MNRKSSKTKKAENLLQTQVTASGRGQAKDNLALARSQFGSSKDQKPDIQKKIPNVHCSDAGGSDTQAWRQLVQERQRNKILQVVQNFKT